MNNKSNVLNIISWVFGAAIFAIGVLNVFLVHTVPGVIYLLLSFVYYPPANAILKKKVRLLDSARRKNPLGHSHYLVHVRCERPWGYD